MSIEADRERISLGMKQLFSDSFGDYAESNKKGSRVKATIIGSNEDRVGCKSTLSSLDPMIVAFTLEPLLLD